MRTVFNDTVIQKKFAENGFAVIDVPERELLDVLETTYAAHRYDESEGLALSIKSTSFSAKKDIHCVTAEIMQPFFNVLLNHYRPAASGFINKLPRQQNTAGLHRDPTFCDETKFTSLLFWCPLTDTDEHNGTLGVIPRSNQIFKGFKSMGPGQYDYSHEETAILEKYGRLLPLKRGQAVVLDTATLHFSPQNVTDKCRLVYSSFLVPSEANLFCVHNNTKRQTVDFYEATDLDIVNYYGLLFDKSDLPLPLVKQLEFTGPQKITYSNFAGAYEGLISS